MKISPPNCFLILGCPRSGTTLLAQSLSLHSQIHVPYETDILVPAAFILHRVRDEALGKKMIAELIINSYFFHLSLGEHLSHDDVRNAVNQSQYALHSIFTNLFSRLADKVCKPIIGDKSPHDIFDLLILKQTELFHDSIKVIHIIRDVRDVMVSLSRQNWFTHLDDWFPRKWSETNLFLQAYFDNKPNYFFMRYEDFVSAPQQWLQAVCDFMDVEYEERMLQTTAFPELYQAMPAHNHLFDPIGKQRIGLWKKHLTETQAKSYEHQAREALLKFGYEKEVKGVLPMLAKFVQRS